MSIRYRTIDRRNPLHGEYKYQLRMNNICENVIRTRNMTPNYLQAAADVMNWIKETYGNEFVFITNEGSKHNEHYRYVRKRYGSNLLYLKDSDVLSYFLLKWS